MTNFLKETIEDLKQQGIDPDDVVWVGSSDGKFSVSWTDFMRFADVNYDSGFGGQEIADDIVIVGKDWWFSRHEYDGSEGWEFHTLPTRSKTPKAFNVVKNGDSWASIENMMKPGGKYGSR